MEHIDKATLDQFVQSITTPTAQQNNENKIQFNDEIPQMPPPKKISMTSSNDGDYDSNDATPKPTMTKTVTKSLSNPPNIQNNIFSDSEPGHDDPIELTAMHERLQYLVHTEARKSGVRINIPPVNEQPQYGDDPNENHLIALMNQQSLQNVIQKVTQRKDSVTSPIHPAVQKLYEQQQTLLEKLQLLEKDDPNPHSVKLWNVMQRIFTEENAQQRQKNIEDLTNMLDKKHREVTTVQNKNGNDILESIHELSKETNNELKEMRQQLNEEKKANKELRNKIKKKNRQLKMWSAKQHVTNNIIDDDDNGYIAPMAYDPNTINGQHRNHKHHNNNQVSLDSIDTAYSLTENNKNKSMNTFQNWCINMGFANSKTSCSWF